MLAGDDDFLTAVMELPGFEEGDVRCFLPFAGVTRGRRQQLTSGNRLETSVETDTCPLSPHSHPGYAKTTLPDFTISGETFNAVILVLIPSTAVNLLICSSVR